MASVIAPSPSVASRPTRSQKRKVKAERKRIRGLINNGALPGASYVSEDSSNILGQQGLSTTMTSSTMQMVRSCWDECQNNAASESSALLEEVAEEHDAAASNNRKVIADEDDWVFVDVDKDA